MPVRLHPQPRSLVNRTPWVLDGVRYFLDFQWNTRSRSWYGTLRDVNFDVVVPSRRLAPGGTFATLPEGVVLVVGDEPYGEDAFVKRQLSMEFWTTEEIAERDREIVEEALRTVVIR